jgi:hypothetical protein
VEVVMTVAAVVAIFLLICLAVFLRLAARAPLDDSEREAYRQGEGYVSRPLPKRRSA